VHHCATTAGRFVEGNQERFDLVVNDMRMDPQASVAIMNSAADALAPGALAIVTLKIGAHRPGATVVGRVRPAGSARTRRTRSVAVGGRALG
jgi:23S rRNA (cytidine2498-2'-O)-methyltransferase